MKAQTMVNPNPYIENHTHFVIILEEGMGCAIVYALFNSIPVYQDEGRVIMKGSVQCSAVKVRLESRLQ